jgi:hypothetical protein
MRRSASEIIRSLESRVARLEGKNAGLIKPPKHLVDKITEILRAGFASGWVNKQMREDDKYRFPLSLEHISDFEYSLENLKATYMGTRVGEATFEELDIALRDLKTETQDITSMFHGTESFNLKFFNLILESMSSFSVFEEPETHSKDFENITKYSKKIVPELKSKIPEEPLSYISERCKRLYESEAKKVRRFDKLKIKENSQTWVLQTQELGAVRLSLKEGGLALAYYNYVDNIHNIGLFLNPNSTDLSEKHLKRIKGYVRHEIVHAMQKQMSLNFNVEQSGIPSRKYDETYRTHMMNTQKEKDLKKQYAMEGLDPRLIQIHALDDIEFYSRLLDEVVDFQKLNVSGSDLNQKAHKWINGRQFFATLKRFKKKNWSKAVGLFIEAVQNS